MKILLDTTAYVGFKRNINDFVDVITSAEQIFFSPIVLGELMFGFRNGTKFEKNMQDLNRFLDHAAVEIALIGKVTSDRYSRIVAQLRHQGTPIPTNDLWIAAQTIEHGAELISSDRHFEMVPGLVYKIF